MNQILHKALFWQNWPLYSIKTHLKHLTLISVRSWIYRPTRVKFSNDVLHSVFRTKMFYKFPICNMCVLYVLYPPTLLSLITLIILNEHKGTLKLTTSQWIQDNINIDLEIPITNDAKCTHEIKFSIVIAKQHSIRRGSFHQKFFFKLKKTSELNHLEHSWKSDISKRWQEISEN